MVRMQVLIEIRDAIIERVVMNRIRGNESVAQLKKYIQEETRDVLDEIQEEFEDRTATFLEEILEEYDYKLVKEDDVND